MAIVTLIIEDKGPGEINIELECNEGFSGSSKEWTDAQQMGIQMYTSLGAPKMSLEDTETEGSA